MTAADLTAINLIADSLEDEQAEKLAYKFGEMLS